MSLIVRGDAFVGKFPQPLVQFQSFCYLASDAHSKTDCPLAFNFGI
ncbi:hypothetical protein SBA4_1710006 [Candidatus Sulfopaludibacter sp. SbA4]|nr:hypothetical protein SBA4_1710006 [Candidatus Sulfopaludibacter sp. SbA4]